MRFLAFWWARWRRLVTEVLTFGLVGVFTNVVYFAFLPLLVLVFNVDLWLAGGISYAVSMLVNYTLQRRVTFRSRSAYFTSGSRYLIVQFIALGMNSSFLHVLVTKMGWHIIIGQGIALLATTTWNYLAQKFWVFADGRKQRDT